MVAPDGLTGFPLAASAGEGEGGGLVKVEKSILSFIKTFSTAGLSLAAGTALYIQLSQLSITRQIDYVRLHKEG